MKQEHISLTILRGIMKPPKMVEKAGVMLFFRLNDDKLNMTYIGKGGEKVDIYH